MGHLPARGIVGFAAAGAAASLHFTNQALAGLEADLGPSWFQTAMLDLDMALSNPQHVPVATVMTLLRRGLVVGDRRDEAEINAAIDALPLWESYKPLQDALALAVSGKTFDAFLADMQRRAAELEKAAEAAPANPPKPEA